LFLDLGAEDLKTLIEEGEREEEILEIVAF
jgi:hypothetical protein